MKVKMFDISLLDMTETAHDIKELFQQEGVILIRGVDFNENQFESFTRIFCDEFCRISSRVCLSNIKGDGLTTHTFGDNFFLFSHSEAAYAPYPKTPDIGFLMCTLAPSVSGGETTLVDGVAFLNAMSHHLRERFENEKITYEFLWEPDRWKAQFKVSLEKELLDLLSTLDTVEFTLKNGVLHMFYTTSAITKMMDGSYAFSNGVLAHLPYIDHPFYQDKKVYFKDSNRVYWESGELLSKDIVNQLISIQDILKYKHRWQDNDVLIFNNLRYMHGRETVQGVCDRKLLSRFGYVSKSNQGCFHGTY